MFTRSLNVVFIDSWDRGSILALIEWVWLEAKIRVTSAATYCKRVHQEITAGNAKTEK
jgi:hypothetical protein